MKEYFLENMSDYDAVLLLIYIWITVVAYRRSLRNKSSFIRVC